MHCNSVYSDPVQFKLCIITPLGLELFLLDEVAVEKEGIERGREGKKKMTRPYTCSTLSKLIS